MKRKKEHANGNKGLESFGLKTSSDGFGDGCGPQLCENSLVFVAASQTVGMMPTRVQMPANHMPEKPTLYTTAVLPQKAQPEMIGAGEGKPRYPGADVPLAHQVFVVGFPLSFGQDTEKDRKTEKAGGPDDGARQSCRSTAPECSRTLCSFLPTSLRSAMFRQSKRR